MLARLTEISEDSIFYAKRDSLVGQQVELLTCSRPLRGGFYGGLVRILTGPLSGRELSVVGFKFDQGDKT